MANPQKENGYTAIANEILEILVKTPLPPSEYQAFLFVVRKTYGYQKKEDKISLTQFELGTGLSRPSVVKALKNLISRNMIVKSPLLYLRINKDWETWVVNPPKLVKYSDRTGKPAFTEIGKPALTHKRKKKMTKEIVNVGTSPTEIAELIKIFETINPACSRFYGNKTQRQACEDLISSYGFERVKTVIEKTLPKTNTLQFFPVITTPLQLFNKWVVLESAIKRYQLEKKQSIIKNKVAF